MQLSNDDDFASLIAVIPGSVVSVFRQMCTLNSQDCHAGPEGGACNR